MTPRVGLQLYTVRDLLAKDFLGTLRAVAQLGYPGVQLAGYGGMKAADLKRVVDILEHAQTEMAAFLPATPQPPAAAPVQPGGS